MELEGKSAVVTGGARRLGRAMALALANRGVRVAIHYAESGEEAEETVSIAREMGTEAISLQADLAQEDPVHRVIAEAADQFGVVDILVNNAALFKPGGFAQTNSEDWDRHFAVNLKAPFLLSQDFAAQVPADRRGKIVNLGDWRGLRPGRDHFAYTIAKAALVGLTQATALALAPNIQVNCLALGAILSPEGADEAFQEKLLSRIPAGRMGGKESVTDALLFLLEGGDYITGETLFIDGGRHLA